MDCTDGFAHDLSKYMPSEFWVGVKYYQGTQSPNNAEREVLGYSSAWLHHKGLNKHHYEYWLDYGIHAGDGITGSHAHALYCRDVHRQSCGIQKL